MNRTINTTYWLGNVVYLRVNDDAVRGMVTSVCITASGAYVYSVTWRGGSETRHYECELTSEYVPDFGVNPAEEAAK